MMRVKPMLEREAKLPERPLLSGGRAPHIVNMTTIERPQTDASCHAAAIARWDGEGGAATALAVNTEGQRSEKRRFKVPASEKVDQAFADDERILGCLGAAVMMRWGTLPTKIQRELFEHATSLADLRQTAQLKGRIARFLHDHKDDGFQPTESMPLQDLA